MRVLRALPTLAFVILIASLCTKPAQGQTTEAEIASTYKGGVLFLRGFWESNNLHFRADGRPVKSYRPGPFTESGFRLESVKLSPTSLKLEGHRVAFFFDKSQTLQAALVGGKDVGPHMRIEIDGAPGQDYATALQSILTSNVRVVAPSLPDYWQRWVRVFLRQPPLPVDPEVRHMDAPKDPNGKIKAPLVIFHSEPEISDIARAVQFSGDVQVYLVVDTAGNPQHISIVRPAGLGLDEDVVEAVSRYRFRPATQNGRPVPVDLYIDVNISFPESGRQAPPRR